MTIAPGHSPGKARLWLAGAAALAALGAFVLFRAPQPPEPTQDVVAAPPAPVARSGAEAARVAPAAKQFENTEPPEPEVVAAPNDEAAGDGDPAPAVPSGIGLFPPPGTEPVRVGIVVPDDFELPEGFMRHYQVTDDGQELPPILLVHPDYELLDAEGNPVPRPEGGVVPPELVPEGMPIHPLVVPEPRDESGP